jgi:hypothetical protein
VPTFSRNCLRINTRPLRKPPNSGSRDKRKIGEKLPCEIDGKVVALDKFSGRVRTQVFPGDETLDFLCDFISFCHESINASLAVGIGTL